MQGTSATQTTSSISGFRYCVDNMLFEEGALLAQFRGTLSEQSDEDVCLLVEALIRNGEIKRSYNSMLGYIKQQHQSRTASNGAEGGPSPLIGVSNRMRYLLAVCALRLERPHEVVDALLLDVNQQTQERTRSPPSVVNGPAGLYILGQAYELLKRVPEAVECYTRCLNECPYIFQAFQRLTALCAVESDMQFQRPTPTRVYLERVYSSEYMEGACAKFATHATTKSDLYEQKPGATEADFNELLREHSKLQRTAVAGEIEDLAKAVERAPPRVSKGGFALATLGKAYFDAARYSEADDCFYTIVTTDPFGFGVNVLDCYSSVLWHLRREASLVTLIRDYVGVLDKHMASQLWVGMGNALSAHDDSENAVKLFKRALTISPNYSYAHCLLGHEYLSSDKLVKARSSFQKAIECDARSYSAYWGLGHVSMKAEEFLQARAFFLKAVEINPNHPVLRHSLSTALQCCNEVPSAIQHLLESLKTWPTNPLALVQKACLELARGHQADAQSSLSRALKLCAPDAALYFLAGRILAAGNDVAGATSYLTAALDLSTSAKEHRTIRAFMVSLTHGGSTESSRQPSARGDGYIGRQGPDATRQDYWQGISDRSAAGQARSDFLPLSDVFRGEDAGHSSSAELVDEFM